MISIIISMANNMISNAIWCKWPRVNFPKTTKLHESVGQVQFVVFENLPMFTLHQITGEIMLLLVNNVHEKNIVESQDRRNFESMHLYL